MQWALDSAVAQGMKVINMSIADCGSGEPSGVLDAIADAVSAGVVVVAAAGNGIYSGCSDSDPVSQIARQTGVIAVSAFDTTLAYDVHGQYGSSIVLSAPRM